MTTQYKFNNQKTLKTPLEVFDNLELANLGNVVSREILVWNLKNKTVEFPIFCNNHFDVKFNGLKGEYFLNTTYSNQRITADWLEELQSIKSEIETNYI